MPDLAVNTAELRSAAAELRTVALAAGDLDDRSARAMAAVPAFGLAGPAQAADAFLSAWVFGVGWIGAQAHEIAGILVGSADAFDAVEARLARELVEGGGGPIAVPPTVLGAAPEPKRPASVTHWGLSGSVSAPMPVQLSSARRAGELIVGDPELVADLARILVGFADALEEAYFSLTRVCLSGWTGATANVVSGQLSQLLDRLGQAERAFALAGEAVGRYVRVHADARYDATYALTLWQGAEHASLWRGMVAGVAPPSVSGEDPGTADMARAALTLARARETLDAAARTLVSALNELEVGSPKDPGVLATITRGVASFGAGFTQGVVRMAEGMIQLGVLGYRVLPIHALYDPDGYLEVWEGIAGGIGHGLMNLDEVGKALIDLDTLRSDPARWAGKLTPELILMIATVGAAGAARAAKAADKLDGAAAAIRQAQIHGDPLFPRVSNSTMDARLAELRLDPASPAGRATRWQLQAPFRDPDQWLNLPLRDGERIAFDPSGRSSGFAAPVTGELPSSSSAWFEALQSPPQRVFGETAPTLPDKLTLYEVRGGDLDAAQSAALGNPQFGVGGGTKVFVADVEDAIASGRLVRVDEHHFDPETTRGRFEDPAYRHVEPTLPERALDPDRERTLGQAERAREETGRFVGGAAASGVYDRMNAADELDQRSTPDQERGGAR